MRWQLGYETTVIRRTLHAGLNNICLCAPAAALQKFIKGASRDSACTGYGSGDEGVLHREPAAKRWVVSGYLESTIFQRFLEANNDNCAGKPAVNDSTQGAG
jgi:hypothetical protein